MKGRAGKLRLSVALGVSLVASLALVAAAFGRPDSSAAPAASAASDRQAVACGTARIGAMGPFTGPRGVDRPGAAQVGPLLAVDVQQGEQDDVPAPRGRHAAQPGPGGHARDAAQGRPERRRRRRPCRQPGDPGGRADVRGHGLHLGLCDEHVADDRQQADQVVLPRRRQRRRAGGDGRERSSRTRSRATTSGSSTTRPRTASRSPTASSRSCGRAARP